MNSANNTDDKAEVRAKTIGVLREKSLHAALKRHYAQPGDTIEAQLEGYSIDIRRGAGRRTRLIEIQTRGFSAIKPKLMSLLPRYQITLVHPIAREKWIVRQDENDARLSRRRSPKQGSVEDVFHELVSIPGLALHPHLRIEVVLTSEEEVRRSDGRGSRRRKGQSLLDRRLIDVVSVRSFVSPEDWLTLLPKTLPDRFTNQELAAALDKPRFLAQRMTYCLRHMDLLDLAGRRGRAREFVIKPPTTAERFFARAVDWATD